MTPIEEALDALTDAMHYHQRACASGRLNRPHDHALLRKLQAAINRLEIEHDRELANMGMADYSLILTREDHKYCHPWHPCNSGCSAGFPSPPVSISTV